MSRAALRASLNLSRKSRDSVLLRHFLAFTRDDKAFDFRLFALRQASLNQSVRMALVDFAGRVAFVMAESMASR